MLTIILHVKFKITLKITFRQIAYSSKFLTRGWQKSDFYKNNYFTIKYCLNIIV